MKATTKKRTGKLTFDQYVSRAVEAALQSANAETEIALTQQRKWWRGWHRELAVKAEAKAKTAATQSWATRWRNIARDQRTRARNNHQDVLSQRYAWPQYANQTLIYPEAHNSHASDCVHVRVFDGRGVPIVRMSLTGSRRFIEGLVRMVSREVSSAEQFGRLDNPDVKVWDETNGLPVEARLG